jgi:hypothetical protein
VIDSANDGRDDRPSWPPEGRHAISAQAILRSFALELGQLDLR